MARSALDPDVRELVEVRIVHGFWRREDERRVRLQVSLDFRLCCVVDS